MNRYNKKAILFQIKIIIGLIVFFTIYLNNSINFVCAANIEGGYNFTNDSDGSTPAGFYQMNSNAGTGKVVNSKAGRVKVVEFVDSSSDDFFGIIHDLPTNITSGLFSYEFWIYIEQATSHNDEVILSIPNILYIYSRCNGSWLCTLKEDSQYNVYSLGKRNIQTWNHIKIIIDLDNEKVFFYVDDDLRGSIPFFIRGHFDIEELWFEGHSDNFPGSGNVYYYLDNVSYTSNGSIEKSNSNKYAMQFDGIDDYIQISNFNQLPIGSNPFSTMMWVLLEDYNGTQSNPLISWGTTETGMAAVDKINLFKTGVLDNRESLEHTFYGVSYTEDVYGFTDLPDSKWFHACVTYDGNTIRIYYNGSLVVEKADDANVVVSDVFIGSYMRTSKENEYLKGCLDEIRIYNRSLSNSEIRYIINNSNPTTQGLLLHFDFEQVSGATCYDQSSNENDGTIYGATLTTDTFNFPTQTSDTNENSNSDLDSNNNPIIDFFIDYYLIIILISITIVISSLFIIKKYPSKIHSSFNKKKQQKIAKISDKKKEYNDIILKIKDLENTGRKKYEKKKYNDAIIKWKDALELYKSVKKITPSSQEKNLLNNNSIELIKSICRANIEQANLHNMSANAYNQKKKLDDAKIQWNKTREFLNETTSIIKEEKLKDFEINPEELNKMIVDIDLNIQCVEIKQSFNGVNESFTKVLSFDQDKLEGVLGAIDLINKLIPKYTKISDEIKSNSKFADLTISIDQKLEEALKFQNRLELKRNNLLTSTQLTDKVSIGNIPDQIRPLAQNQEKHLEITREFDYVGGQVRLKVGLENKSGMVLTNINLIFHIPEAFNWIMQDPDYERKGDVLIIPKIGVGEKKGVSIFLEPIMCTNSPVNIFVSYFDARDNPHSISMEKKMINVICPIFFTEEEINVARIKNLYNKVHPHKDKKVYYIQNINKSNEIFNSILLGISKYDVKIIYKEFSEKDLSGEAWIYGKTKVKKKFIITRIIIDSKTKLVEVGVSGDYEEQITGFLADLNFAINRQLIKQNIISSEELHEIRRSIVKKICPQCSGPISKELIDEFTKGKSIKCMYCNETIINPY